MTRARMREQRSRLQAGDESAGGMVLPEVAIGLRAQRRTLIFSVDANRRPRSLCR